MNDAQTCDRLHKWPIVAVRSGPMPSIPGELTGEKIRRAREALRLTQKQLADELGVGLRTIGRWERDEAVPRSAVGALRRVLQIPDDDEGQTPYSGPPLRTASHAELLAEIARRLEAVRPSDTPDIPPGRYRWPKTATPSNRRSRNSTQAPNGEEEQEQC